MTMADRSVFDGYSLTLYRSNGSIVGSWPAISGKPGNQRPSDQNLPFKGPLTEGRYSFSTGDIQPLTTLDAMLGVPKRGHFPGSILAWGTERAELVPDSTLTNGRNNFFVHGGFSPGSAGCIDLGPNEKSYFDALRSTGEPSHVVVVSYDPSLETSPHPLAEKSLWNGAGEYLTRPLPSSVYPSIAGTERILNNVGRYIGDSLITPAGGALPPPLYNSPDVEGTSPPLPVRRLVRVMADDPRASAFDNGPLAAPSPSNGLLTSDRGDSFGDRFGNWASTGAGDTQQPQAASYSEMFHQYMNQLTAGKSQAPAPSLNINAPIPYQSAPSMFAPPDYSAAAGNGGIENWIASLAGVDPDVPTQFQVPPIFSPLYRR
jgi:hypothetical protein